MLDDKTIELIEALEIEAQKTPEVAESCEKTAETMGFTQAKKREVKSETKYPGLGAGAGAAGGTALGYKLSKSIKHPIARAAATFLGLGAGATAGKQIGDLGTQRKTTTSEGTAKKQEKSKEKDVTPPRLDDSKVLKLLNRK